jgi:hypothetical protein
MHEDGAAELSWRDIVSKHQSAMVEDLSVRLASDLREAISTAVTGERSQSNVQIARACDEARRSHSESLNQALRRLRLATSEQKTLQLLNECCGPYAERSVVLVFEEGRAFLAAANGLSQTGQAGQGSEPVFDLAKAPAVSSAIETRDPIVTIASGDQISPELAAAFGGGGDYDGYEKAWLFPLLSRQAVAAMFIASGEVDPAPVELLCEAASMRLESFSAPASAASRTEAAVPSWDDLSPEDQRLHLLAQRVARVRVAEIRLEEDDALRQGLASANLYSTLGPRIDAARREFLQSFLSKSTTMVDYLHLEILRSLAGNDPARLGAGYPGPMV